MALSPNEIKSRAISFIHDHKDDKYEKGESQIFWRDFFNIWGINAKRVGIFEERAKTLKQTTGFIDYFWPKTILIEQKSKGEDLDKAYKQALDYCLTGGIPDEELPSYICVCDFEKLRLVNFTDQTKTVEFKITDLLDHLQRFNFLLGYEQREYKDEDPVNIKAAELMGKLHDELESNGFTDHPLKLMLVRLMFCFFADDTGIFSNKDDFLFFLKERTKQDGSDLGLWIAQFFQVLNTPAQQRQANLDEDLAKFPYVNGQLFEEAIPFAQFDHKLRDILIQACEFNWALVSPAIFGSLFQSVMNKEKRRELGAHYTSEKNILKTIHGLFLDELIEDFEVTKKKKSVKGLQDLLDRIRKIKILDPACGCGNFLILSYRELRRLEIKLIREVRKLKGLGQELSIHTLDSLDVDCLYGIELEEFPAQIAKTAIWIMDHLMNVEMGKEFGDYYVRLPLKKSPVIKIGNSLQLDWNSVVSKDTLTYVIGNPPFVGTAYQNQSQKEDMAKIFSDVKSFGMLDYVSAWYEKVCQLYSGTNVKIGFVSTNSIIQGEQASVLFGHLFQKFKLNIFFAHQTFSWSSEAKGKAAVHVVIIGFGFQEEKKKFLYTYESLNSEPAKIPVNVINQYLVDSKPTIITSKTYPICNVPKIGVGSALLDGGNLILSEKEVAEIIVKEPELKEFILPLWSAEEFLNNSKRFCFWLKNANPSILKESLVLNERLKLVRDFRLSSNRPKTKEFASFPFLFGEERQPSTDFLLIPKVSSQNREYIPLGYMTKNDIITDKVFAMEDAKLYHFGILSSQMHNSWMRRVAGRLKSDYSYSNSLVYNNFPWPENPTDKQMIEIESFAQSVLDSRAQFPESSLADLYDPLTMPKVLRDSHNKLDKAVDKAYRSKPFQSEFERVEFLFELYEMYSNTLTSKIKEPKKSKK